MADPPKQPEPSDEDKKKKAADEERKKNDTELDHDLAHVCDQLGIPDVGAALPSSFRHWISTFFLDPSGNGKPDWPVIGVFGGGVALLSAFGFAVSGGSFIGLLLGGGAGAFLIAQFGEPLLQALHLRDNLHPPVGPNEKPVKADERVVAQDKIQLRVLNIDDKNIPSEIVDVWYYDKSKNELLPKGMYEAEKTIDDCTTVLKAFYRKAADNDPNHPTNENEAKKVVKLQELVETLSTKYRQEKVNFLYANEKLKKDIEATKKVKEYLDKFIKSGEVDTSQLSVAFDKPLPEHFDDLDLDLDNYGQQMLDGILATVHTLKDCSPDEDAFKKYLYGTQPVKKLYGDGTVSEETKKIWANADSTQKRIFISKFADYATDRWREQIAKDDKNLYEKFWSDAHYEDKEAQKNLAKYIKDKTYAVVATILKNRLDNPVGLDDGLKQQLHMGVLALYARSRKAELDNELAKDKPKLEQLETTLMHDLEAHADKVKDVKARFDEFAKTGLLLVKDDTSQPAQETFTLIDAREGSSKLHKIVITLGGGRIDVTEDNGPAVMHTDTLPAMPNNDKGELEKLKWLEDNIVKKYTIVATNYERPPIEQYPGGPTRPQHDLPYGKPLPNTDAPALV